MEIAAANEICRQSQKVFLPLLPASKTPLCQSSASLPLWRPLVPQPLHSLHLWVDFAFAELHVTAAQRPAGSLAQHRLSGVARAPNSHLNFAQLARQGAHPHLPATWASPLQPNPPMHFPFWPGLSNPGIWNKGTLASAWAQLLTPPTDQYHILNHLTPASPLFLPPKVKDDQLICLAWVDGGPVDQMGCRWFAQLWNRKDGSSGVENTPLHPVWILKGQFGRIKRAVQSSAHFLSPPF